MMVGRVKTLYNLISLHLKFVPIYTQKSFILLTLVRLYTYTLMCYIHMYILILPFNLDGGRSAKLSRR